MNEAQMKQIGNSKAKMLEAIQKMERIVDNYWGGNLQRDIERLRDALENSTEDELSEVISDTVDGCGTAISELRDLNWALDSFEEAQSVYDKTFSQAIDEFENSLNIQ
jgi:t-SNARE complex subunit (syntaxin)